MMSELPPRVSAGARLAIASCSACSDEKARDVFGRHEPAPKVHQINSGSCGKLLKVNAGEVAERLNAAVC
jgi:hypothetical protein